MITSSNLKCFQQCKKNLILNITLVRCVVHRVLFVLLHYLVNCSFANMQNRPSYTTSSPQRSSCSCSHSVDLNSKPTWKIRILLQRELIGSNFHHNSMGATDFLIGLLRSSMHRSVLTNFTQTTLKWLINEALHFTTWCSNTTEVRVFVENLVLFAVLKLFRKSVDIWLCHHRALKCSFFGTLTEYFWVRATRLEFVACAQLRAV